MSTCGLSANSWLRVFAAATAAVACSLLAVVGAVVIPQQNELSRRQEEALRNHEVLRKHQLEILQRVSSLEGQAKTALAVMNQKPERP